MQADIAPVIIDAPLLGPLTAADFRSAGFFFALLATVLTTVAWKKMRETA